MDSGAYLRSLQFLQREHNFIRYKLCHYTIVDHAVIYPPQVLMVYTETDQSIKYRWHTKVDPVLRYISQIVIFLTNRHLSPWNTKYVL